MAISELQIDRVPPTVPAIPAFDAAMRVIAGNAYKGLTIRRDKMFLITEGATEEQINALVQAALVHDYSLRTAAQTVKDQGKTDTDSLLAQIDTALSEIASKEAALRATQNLANAGALLLELSEDMTGVLKALRYVINHRLV